MRELEARRDAAIQQLISLADTAPATHQPGVAAQDYKRVLSIEPGNPALAVQLLEFRFLAI